MAPDTNAEIRSKRIIVNGVHHAGTEESEKRLQFGVKGRNCRLSRKEHHPPFQAAVRMTASLEIAKVGGRADWAGLGGS